VCPRALFALTLSDCKAVRLREGRHKQNNAKDVLLLARLHLCIALCSLMAERMTARILSRVLRAGSGDTSEVFVDRLRCGAGFHGLRRGIVAQLVAMI